jgi:hypothetical protein
MKLGGGLHWRRIGVVGVIQAAIALVILGVPAGATGTAASPAGGARKAVPSKVPTLIRKEIAQIRSALRGSASHVLSARQADTISAGFLRTRADGGIDVQLHVVGRVGADQLRQLAKLGVDVRASSADYAPVAGVDFPDAGLVHAIVPYDKVDAVAALGWVAAVRPTIRPAVDAGPVTTEGVPLHNADDAQAAGYTGAGQKVGAISDGVTSLADSQAQGELPADVQVLDAGNGDEGTAMLEIVHDMAPGATLAFNTVGDSLTSYVGAFHNLANAGATLITEDIAIDDEPAFQQGIAATTAEDLAQHGVWISSSAGNLGGRHAPRVPAAGTGRTPDDAAGGTYANCGGGAPMNTVNLRGTDNTYNLNLLPGAALLVTLQWSEPRAIFPTAGQGGFTNLDLYLVDAAGTDCLAFSNAAQANGVGDTIEQFIYQNTSGAPQPTRLVVNVAGTSSAARTPLLDLRWRALSAGVQTLDPPDRAGSLNPDSNYLGFATSAGAVNASVSTDPATVPLESYSAAGPVQIGVTSRCPSGSPGPCKGRPGPEFKTFGAPNWAAADGVSVSGAGGFGSGTCPTVVQGLCRFFGTSASAPGAAGVAALVLEENGGKTAPRNLNSLLAGLAVPRGGGAFGAGVLRAIQ